jgi:hypothetical protein
MHVGGCNLTLVGTNMITGIYLKESVFPSHQRIFLVFKHYIPGKKSSHLSSHTQNYSIYRSKQHACQRLLAICL